MKITYEDKETKINNESIPIKNKVTAENMNEIKNTVNSNDDEVKQIKAILPTTTGTGTSVTLNNTAEMEFVKSPIPMGNSEQDGTPSPSSEVEVETVTGDVEVKAQNKNLFDIDNVIKNYRLGSDGNPYSDNSYMLTDYFKIKPSTNYIYNRNSNGGGSACIAYYDNNKGFISRIMWSSSSQQQQSIISITTPQNATYARMTDLKTLTKIQLEENSTATDYVEHKEQLLPLTLGDIELCKIGDYQDYIYKENNKWYLHKEIEKYIFDGSEEWKNFASVSGSSDTISMALLQTPMGARTGYSDLFPVIADYSATEHIVIAGSLVGIYIEIANSRLSTVNLEGFKNWLSSNNVTFYGISATSTDTEITNTTLISQLENILNATSYEGQTNINGTSTNANPIFNVEAYQSIRLVLAG